MDACVQIMAAEGVCFEKCVIGLMRQPFSVVIFDFACLGNVAYVQPRASSHEHKSTTTGGVGVDENRRLNKSNCQLDEKPNCRQNTVTRAQGRT